MRDIVQVDYLVVQQHEKLRESSIGLDNHYIPDFCPRDEVRCYKVLLDEKDINRIFLLNLPQSFGILTNNGTHKLADVSITAWEEPRVSYFREKDIDLRTEPEFEVILFGQNLDTSALTATDGNHRLMAQFLTYGTIANVPAYVYIHKNINNWYFVPPLAR